MVKFPSKSETVLIAVPFTVIFTCGKGPLLSETTPLTVWAHSALPDTNVHNSTIL